MKKQANNDPSPRRSLALISAANEAQALWQTISDRLPSIENQLDEAAAAPNFDAAASQALSERKQAAIAEMAVLSRRIALLREQAEVARKEEATTERLPEIIEALGKIAEEGEALQEAWQSSLTKLLESCQAFLPLSRRRQELLHESEYLRVRYNTGTLPPIAPLGLPSADALKTIGDSIAQLRGPFPDRFAQEKQAIQEQRRRATPPPTPPTTQKVVANLIERDTTPAAPRTYDTRYQPGLVSIEGQGTRRPSMAERKAS